MGDFNYGHIQWKSLESTGGEGQQFIFLIQLPYSARARTNQGRKCIRYSFIINLVKSVKKETIWQANRLVDSSRRY